MSPTGFLHHPTTLRHDTGPGHPERPERAAAVMERLASSGLLDELDVREPEPAPLAAVTAVHTESHLAAVRAAAERGPGRLDADTSVSPASFEAALLAAGAALEAVDAVYAGRWTNAFANVRPPGHHAECGQAMGFCLFNNAAVAAAHLLREHGLERVAVLDWDVHHGNGTQHLFEGDPRVFYASLHQWPHYPGTGAATERGRGAGEGTTLNAPLPAGSGDAEWLAALENTLLPALEDFAPEFVIVSAGFDAHAEDQLSGTLVTEAGYRAMTRSVLDFASRMSDGKLVSLLEGGYALDALARSVEVHVEELRDAQP